MKKISEKWSNNRQLGPRPQRFASELARVAMRAGEIVKKSKSIPHHRAEK